MSYYPGQAKSIRVTTGIATALHLLILLGVAIAGAYSVTQQNSQREVTLSVFHNTDKPDDADFIAPENQLGSGSLEAHEELSTNQLSLAHDKQTNEIFLNTELANNPEVIAVDNIRIVTTTSSSQHFAIVDENLKPQKNKEVAKEESVRTIADLNLQIASLEAKLLDNVQSNAKKTRAKIVTSISALASNDAAYLHQWRDRIETVGNLHYPDEARRQSLYGDVRLLVKLHASGLVEEIAVLASSGSSILDQAAIESIRLASPFEPFPQALAAEYDRLDIIRTWQFRKNRVTAIAKP